MFAAVPSDTPMTHWNIQFLGIPTASRNGQTVRLRSKIAWAVLASLLLDTPPPRLSRAALAEQFWEDKNDPRTHLRQAIQSLKDNFGEDAFSIDRDTIQAIPGYFKTDIGEMMRFYQEAQSLSDSEMRLSLLCEAERKIGGTFLDECLSPLDVGGLWHTGVAIGIEAKITQVFLALLEAYRNTNNLNGAFDIALRLLTLSPNHPAGKKLAWELAVKTGQEKALEVLESVQDYRLALPRVTEMERKGHSLTSRDARLFETLLEERLKTLPATLKNHLMSLALFPAPLSAPLAQEVCDVSLSSLTALVDADLVTLKGGRYALLEVIKRVLWRQVSASDKRAFNHCLTKICSEWVVSPESNHLHCSPIFASVEEARPYVDFVLEERLASPITAQTLDFLFSLDAAGLQDLMPSRLTRLKSAAQDRANEQSLRVSLARIVGNILCNQRDFREATRWFDLALTLTTQTHREVHKDLLFQKAQSAHYGGDSEAAVLCLQEIISSGREEGSSAQVASAHRFLCEVLNHLRKYEVALVHVETAYALHQKMGSLPVTLADARFWQGKTLIKLNRVPEAEPYIHEALDLWQEVGEKTGVGHCLRTIAGLQMEQKRYALALANLDHAISLHRQTENEGCRIAAVEVRAELCLRRGRTEEYRRHLEECLTYYEAQGRNEKATSLRTLLTALTVTPV